jgi:hypothetical protein
VLTPLTSTPRILSLKAWRLRIRRMTENRRPCAVTRYLSPSMPPQPVAGAVWQNGTISAGRSADAQQQQYIVGVIHHWLVLQMNPKIDEL